MDNFSLNPEAGTITRGKKTVKLTPVHRRILEVLMDVEGKPTNRKELISLVWDYEPDKYALNNAAVTIYQLRSFLRKHFGTNPIHSNQARKGYVFWNRVPSRGLIKRYCRIV
jgi:DNA-binding winged helix-turn-helix (wHTH) protein